MKTRLALYVASELACGGRIASRAVEHFTVLLAGAYELRESKEVEAMGLVLLEGE